MSTFLMVASTSALSAKLLMGDRKLAVASSVATKKRIAATLLKLDAKIR
jgi:hypothetical protein